MKSPSDERLLSALNARADDDDSDDDERAGRPEAGLDKQLIDARTLLEDDTDRVDTLVLADISVGLFAFIAWHFVGDAGTRQLLSNIVVFSTAMTVLFNLNPLMRFDGNYMMSDFLEIPNLRPKADKLLRESFAWYCLGIESKPDPSSLAQSPW